jgi:hypothetical protein
MTIPKTLHWKPIPPVPTEILQRLVQLPDLSGYYYHLETKDLYLFRAHAGERSANFGWYIGVFETDHEAKHRAHDEKVMRVLTGDTGRALTLEALLDSAKTRLLEQNKPYAKGIISYALAQVIAYAALREFISTDTEYEWTMALILRTIGGGVADEPVVQP